MTSVGVTVIVRAAPPEVATETAALPFKLHRYDTASVAVVLTVKPPGVPAVPSAVQSSGVSALAHSSNAVDVTSGGGGAEVSTLK